MAGTGETYEIISSPLNEITSTAYGAASAFDGIGKAANMAFNPATFQLMLGYKIQVQELQLNLGQASRELEQMEEQVEKVADTGNFLNKAFGFAGNMLGLDKMKQMVSESDKLVQTTAKFDTMNDGLQSTQQLMDMVYASAQDARGSYTDMSTVVASLGNNAQGAFGSSAEIVSFANLMQKQMSIAGAPQAESANALLSLSQSMGNGIMEADSLNAIFAQAPNLIQNIADYLNVPNEKVKELANSGQISTEMFKNAIFAASGEINSEFEQMPMTWGQIWGYMQNVASKNLQSLFQKISDVVNSEGFQNFVNSAISAMGSVCSIVTDIFNLISSVGTFIYNNWSVIAPIVWGIISALTIYTGEMIAYNSIQTISNGIAAISAARSALKAGATLAEAAAAETAAGAQVGWNAALLASPITWIILLIIAFIAGLFALCNWIAKTTQIANSGIGVITGALAVAVSFIGNIFVALVNIVIDIFVVLWNFIAAFVNFFGNAFNDPVAAVGRLFFDLVNSILGLFQTLASVIDAIFGADLGNEIQGYQDSLSNWIDETFGEDKEFMATLKSEDFHVDRFNYGDTFKAGAAWGDGISEKIGGLTDSLDSFSITDAFTDPGADSLSDTLTNISDNTSNISGDTAAISDGVNVSNENLKYLRDLAEQEAVNRFTTAEIKVDMTNNNNIASGVDLDGIISSLSGGLLEAMAVTAEGVHV